MRGLELAIDDLADVLTRNTRLVIVGTGAAGRMQAQPGLEAALRQRGVTMETMPTAEAVRRVNDLLAAGADDWVAAFHLTC